MDAKQKAISLLNSNMKFTYDCATGEKVCARKCPVGVCKSAIHDAKRITQEMIVVICDSHKAEREEMSITLHSIDKIVFWNKVYDEIEKI
jgi:hypothetical protein